MNSVFLVEDPEESLQETETIFISNSDPMLATLEPLDLEVAEEKPSDACYIVDFLPTSGDDGVIVQEIVEDLPNVYSVMVGNEENPVMEFNSIDDFVDASQISDREKAIPSSPFKEPERKKSTRKRKRNVRLEEIEDKKQFMKTEIEETFHFFQEEEIQPSAKRVCISMDENVPAQRTYISAFEDDGHPDPIIEDENHLLYELPFGWIKEAIRRTSGESAGHWDIYLRSPYGKRMRSNVELEKYLVENPGLQIDTNLTRIQRPKGLLNVQRCVPKKKSIETNLSISTVNTENPLIEKTARKELKKKDVKKMENLEQFASEQLFTRRRKRKEFFMKEQATSNGLKGQSKTADIKPTLKVKNTLSRRGKKKTVGKTFLPKKERLMVKQIKAECRQQAVSEAEKEDTGVNQKNSRTKKKRGRPIDPQKSEKIKVPGKRGRPPTKRQKKKPENDPLTCQFRVKHTDPICGNHFEDEQALTDHQMTHIMPNHVFFCAQCNMQFNDIIALDKHATESCTKPSDSEESQAKTIDESLKRKPLKAKNLNGRKKTKGPTKKKPLKTTKGKENRKRGRSTSMVGVPKFQCDYKCTDDEAICGLGFSFEYQLKAHRLSHVTPGRFFQCSQCEIKFSDIGQLNNHVKRCSAKQEETEEEKKENCDANMNQVKEENLEWIDEVLENSQAGPKEPLKCGKCGFVGQDKDDIIVHFSIAHSGNAPPQSNQRLVCEYCFKSYKYNISFKKHMKSCPLSKLTKETFTNQEYVPPPVRVANM